MRFLRFLILGDAVAATVVIGVAVDQNAHSVSDTLIGAAAPVIITWLVAVGALRLAPRTMSRTQ